MNTMSSISAMTKKMAKPPSWNAMGTGTDNNVSAIYALDSNNVYVGGAFTFTVVVPAPLADILAVNHPSNETPALEDD